MKLIFNYGVMNSAKSMHLLTTAFNLEERGIPFLCLKPSIDTRDVDKIKSRVGLERECMTVYPKTNVFELVQTYFNFLSIKDSTLKWILVDEAQFLTTEQVNDLAKVVDILNIGVICYGIRTDFRSKLFEGSKRLFELADEFHELKSSCSCGNKAVINARVDENNNIIVDGEQIEIGGNERYITLCRKCYNKLIHEND